MPVPFPQPVELPVASDPEGVKMAKVLGVTLGGELYLSLSDVVRKVFKGDNIPNTVSSPKKTAAAAGSTGFVADVDANELPDDMKLWQELLRGGHVLNSVAFGGEAGGSNWDSPPLTPTRHSGSIGGSTGRAIRANRNSFNVFRRKMQAYKGAAKWPSGTKAATYPHRPALGRALDELLAGMGLEPEGSVAGSEASTASKW